MENRFGEDMRSPYFYRRRIDSLDQIPVDGERFQVLLSARDYRDRALALIASARKRIYIVALYLQDDAGGLQVKNLDVHAEIEALKAAVAALEQRVQELEAAG